MRKLANSENPVYTLFANAIQSSDKEIHFLFENYNLWRLDIYTLTLKKLDLAYCITSSG